MAERINEPGKGWKLFVLITPDNDTPEAHVVPVGDLREHSMDEDLCWCRPQVQYEGTGILYLHNSADLREASEEGTLQ